MDHPVMNMQGQAVCWLVISLALSAWVRRIQGLSIAVTSKTEIIYLKGYGTAGEGRLMTPQTPMYIGSQSKSFTALAVAQLIEQGKINPGDPVQKYIPWFKVA